MEMTSNDKPLADETLEDAAAAQFPLEVSPEEYAARHAHLWGCFSFDEYRYRNGALDAWILSLGDILFQRSGAPSLAELRARFLSEDEQRELAEAERDEF